jgi:hypothetical protein
MIINKKMLERLSQDKYLYFHIIILRAGFTSLLSKPSTLTGRIEMKQLDIFDTDYESCNYTSTSKKALASIKPKIKTKREQVYDLIKLNPLTNYQISDELEMPLSSVCARVRELQILNLVIDSGLKEKLNMEKMR